MNKKHISLMLAALMCTSSVTPVFAYELDTAGNSIENVEYQNTNDADYSNQTNVFAELSSEYKVTIPKTIVLSGTTKKANYYVKVEGDIAGYETIEVIPDEEVELFAKNKDSQTGIITQDKTTWKYDNFNVNANGEVSAQDLTAGKWAGTFNFTINLESENQETPVALPSPGTTLSDMSFSEIKAVAKAGKTADYNIKVNDIIKVNDNIDAEIIAIGDDYIEFMTVQKVISSSSPRTESTLKTGETVTSLGEAAFYKYPQVNYGDRSNSEEVSYVNSDIKKNLEAWFDAQSDEFKSAVKNIEREYEVATLTFDGSSYSQSITNTIKDTEKVYIPTDNELTNVNKITSNHKSDAFWTATPYEFSNLTNFVSYSYFDCNSYGGRIYHDYGYYCEGAVAMFRIG